MIRRCFFRITLWVSGSRISEVAFWPTRTSFEISFENLPFPEEDLFPMIEKVEELLAGILQCPEEDGDRDLPTPVDPDMEEILLVEFEIDP